MDEQNYIKGFNSGYYLQENEPELFKSILTGTKGDSQYLEGLVAGKEQYEKEVKREKIRESLTKDKTHEKDKGRER